MENEFDNVDLYLGIFFVAGDCGADRGQEGLLPLLPPKH